MVFRFFRQFTTFICILASLFSCSFRHDQPREPSQSLPNKVLIYFVKADKNSYSIRSVARDWKPAEGTRLKQSITQLLQGPAEGESDRGFNTEIPQGSRILSFDEDSERAHINLSEQFMAGGGSQSMQARYKQLFRTIAMNSEQKAVYVSIEGKPLEKLGGEGLVIDNPIYAGQAEISSSKAPDKQDL